MMAPPRLAVLYVQHSPARYPDALPRLRACLDRLWFCEPLLLVIDNSREGDWCTWMGDREAVIGGDNRDWEFSGWQRGADMARALGRGHDMFLLANESFLAPGPSFLTEHPSYDRICGWRRDGAVAGRIDRYETPATLCGRPMLRGSAPAPCSSRPTPWTTSAASSRSPPTACATFCPRPAPLA